MIPKIIHYCWFGGNPLPKLARKCIKSWKKFCPDYEIIRWDESNFDVPAAPLYVRQAYEAKKWAFVTDYVRLKVIYDNGGIYMDTDVELIKSLDGLLSHKAYFGFEKSGFDDKDYVNTGLGFGAEKGCPILLEMMNDYEKDPFVLEDGSFDGTTCPKRNTLALMQYGFIPDGQYQELDGIAVYPAPVFCPLSYDDGVLRKDKQTISIHWFTASWWSREMQKSNMKRQKKRRESQRREFWRYLPNRMILRLLGEDKYTELKRKIIGK